MNKIILSTAVGLVFSLAIITKPTQANEALTTINTQVEQRASYLDDKFGVLLTYQELQDLKIALIAKTVVTSEALAAGKSSQDLANEASQTYQIEGETAKRQLLIEIDSSINYLADDNSGIKPKCC